MSKVVFRLEASAKIGYGHLMRCLVLADHLKKRNVESIFVCKKLDEKPMALLHSRHYDVVSLSAGNDAEETINVIRNWGADMLILDHYGLDASWQSRVRPAVKLLIVIDDLADRPHECDYLIDQSFGRKKRDYIKLVPEKSQLLLGSEYGLLSENFSALRSQALERRHATQSLDRLLISMGGTDSDNATGLVLDALCAVDARLKVDVVVNESSPYLESLRLKISHLSHDIELHTRVTDLSQFMLMADFAIGAGGVTSYERCCLGLPTLLMVVADNQTFNAKSLERSGAVRYLGIFNELSKQSIEAAISSLYSDINSWKKMSNAAASVCDGLGASRVVDNLLNPSRRVDE